MFEIDQKYKQQKLTFKFKFKTFIRNIDCKKKSISFKNKNKKKRKFFRKNFNVENENIIKFDKTIKKLVIKKIYALNVFFLNI